MANTSASAEAFINEIDHLRGAIFSLQSRNLAGTSAPDEKRQIDAALGELETHAHIYREQRRGASYGVNVPQDKLARLENYAADALQDAKDAISSMKPASVSIPTRHVENLLGDTDKGTFWLNLKIIQSLVMDKQGPISESDVDNLLNAASTVQQLNQQCKATLDAISRPGNHTDPALVRSLYEGIDQFDRGIHLMVETTLDRASPATNGTAVLRAPANDTGQVTGTIAQLGVMDSLGRIRVITNQADREQRPLNDRELADIQTLVANITQRSPSDDQQFTNPDEMLASVLQEIHDHQAAHRTPEINDADQTEVLESALAASHREVTLHIESHPQVNTPAIGPLATNTLFAESVSAAESDISSETDSPARQRGTVKEAGHQMARPFRAMGRGFSWVNNTIGLAKTSRQADADISSFRASYDDIDKIIATAQAEGRPITNDERTTIEREVAYMRVIREIDTENDGLMSPLYGTITDKINAHDRTYAAPLLGIETVPTDFPPLSYVPDMAQTQQQAPVPAAPLSDANPEPESPAARTTKKIPNPLRGKFKSPSQLLNSGSSRLADAKVSADPAKTRGKGLFGPFPSRFRTSTNASKETASSEEKIRKFSRRFGFPTSLFSGATWSDQTRAVPESEAESDNGDHDDIYTMGAPATGIGMSQGGSETDIGTPVRQSGSEEYETNTVTTDPSIFEQPVNTQLEEFTDDDNASIVGSVYAVSELSVLVGK